MTNSTDIHDAIVAADETFMTTFSRGDAAGIAALYTENGQFLPPNSDFVTGKQAIQATFQAFMDMGIKAIKLETVEVEEYGDTASEVGRYTLEGQGVHPKGGRELFYLWYLMLVMFHHDKTKV